jgi:hypothetical protein
MRLVSSVAVEADSLFATTGLVATATAYRFQHTLSVQYDIAWRACRGTWKPADLFLVLVR